MRKTLLALTILSVTSAPAFAQEGRRILPQLPAGGTVLHLNESADMRLEHDRLAVTLMASHNATDQAEVQNIINKQMKTALDVAKRFKDVKTSTGGYNVYRQFGRDNSYETWQGQQTITLDGSNFDDVMEASSALQAKDLTVQDMRYYVSDEKVTAQKANLIQKALEKAQVQAQAMAKQLGRSHVDVVEVQAGGGYAPMPPRPMMAMAMKGARDSVAMESMQGQAGEDVVSQNIQVMFYLLP